MSLLLHAKNQKNSTRPIFKKLENFSLGPFTPKKPEQDFFKETGFITF